MGAVESPRILVIEDDLDFAPVLERLLKKKLGAEVVVAEDCARARVALARSSFDLITLDYQLPDGDGLDLLEEIKQGIGLTPVVMVTGHGDERTAVRAFQAGVSGYVVKDRRLTSILPSTLEQALDHRLTEECLRASEARFRRLFEAAKDGILLLDAETGRITDVNPFLKDLLGYSREEMMGSTLWEIGPFKDVAESKGLFRELQQETYVRYEHLPLQAKDGHSVDVEFVSNVYQVDHTKVIQCNIRDITERKRAQEKSEEHFSTLAGIIESTDNPIFSVDREYRYTSFNLAHAAVMKALYGADIELGGSLLEYQTAEEDRAEAQRNIDLALNGERVVEEAISGDVARSRLFFEVVHNPIIGRKGQIVGVAIFAKDITEHHRYEEELKQVNAELQGYAHTVSHDLRGPLASMGMSLAMLRELLEGPPSEESGLEILEALDWIGLSLERADGLIGTLLKLAEAGQVPEEVIDINVAQMVKRVLDERAKDIKAKGIKVEVDADLGHVVADYSHVYQLFSNLLANAIQHNDSEAPVIKVLSLGEDGEGAHRYLVRDNGSGIPPESIDRIFVPFFKGKTGSSGIGLSTVKKIVKLYGGDITACNDGGACFELTLRDYEP
jgi:two-component system cell cycle sensor histidine kinase/response regulator CckA